MQLGGEWGQLGYPVEGEKCGTVGGGCYQKYQGGYMIWSQQTGAWESIGAIRDRWMQLGGEWGQLGYPVEGEVCVRSDNSQCTQKFENGTTLKWTKQGGVTIQ